VWALIFGSVAVVAQYFAGPLVDPGGFGLDRWTAGFVDVVGVPVLVPLVLYLLFVEMGLVSRRVDHAGFVLLWLIPLSAYRAIQWISPRSPVTLILVPVLWSAIAVGMAGMFEVARKSRWHLAVPLAVCMAALPFAAATSWWAFFSHRPGLGLALLVASVVPALVCVVSWFRGWNMAPNEGSSYIDEEDPYPDARNG